MSKFTSCIIATALLLLIGCKKEYLEIVPVLEMQDISIPITATVTQLDFLSGSVGFAVPATGNVMYRTVDGGTNWQAITVGNSSIHRSCFLTAEKGFVLTGNQLRYTEDGGQDWSSIGEANFIGKTISGLIVHGRFPLGNYFSTIIRVSADSGQTFQTISSTFNWYGNVRVSGDKVILWGDGSIGIIDPITGSVLNRGYSPESYGGMMDMHFLNNCGTMVGESGDIQDGCFDTYFNRRNPWSMKDLRAVDGKATGPWFTVGENAIMTNYDTGTGEWNEVFDTEGRGITGSFHSINMISPSLIVIGGTNGKILKCNF